MKWNVPLTLSGQRDSGAFPRPTVKGKFLELDGEQFFVKGARSREVECGNFKPAKGLCHGSIVRRGY